MPVDPVRPVAPHQCAEQSEPVALGDAEGDHQVVEHALRQENLRHLEGAAEPEAGDLAHRTASDVAAQELDPAVGRRQVAGDHVDEGGLAGAVGADHADGLALLDSHVDVVGRDDGAEALLETLDVEYDGHRPYASSRSACGRLRSWRRLFQRSTRDHSPLGRNMMISSSVPPMMSCQIPGNCSNA